jgi:hypothetical protein
MDVFLQIFLLEHLLEHVLGFQTNSPYMPYTTDLFSEDRDPNFLDILTSFFLFFRSSYLFCAQHAQEEQSDFCTK